MPRESPFKIISPHYRHQVPLNFLAQFSTGITPGCSMSAPWVSQQQNRQNLTLIKMVFRNSRILYMKSILRWLRFLILLDMSEHFLFVTSSLRNRLRHLLVFTWRRPFDERYIAALSEARGDCGTKDGCGTTQRIE